MNKKLKKQQRRLAIYKENNQRICDRIARSPLNKDEMLSLVAYVGSNIVKNGENHNSFTYTNKWLIANKIKTSSAHEFFYQENLKDDWSILMYGDPYHLFGPSSTRIAWMPLEELELKLLLIYLEKKLNQADCDHKLYHTINWLSKIIYDPTVVQAALFAQGGFCDCEVMFNVNPENIYPVKMLTNNKGEG